MLQETGKRKTDHDESATLYVEGEVVESGLATLCALQYNGVLDIYRV